MVFHKNKIFYILLFYSALSLSQEDFYTLQAKWNNGLKFENENKSFKINIGGFLMIDHAFFSHNDDLNNSYGELSTKNGTQIRRARLFTSGILHSNIEYKLDVSFEGDHIGLKDAFVGLKNIPVIGTLRIGNVKEPFRLDILTSSKFNTFLERSFIIDFVPIRNNGVLIVNNYLKNRLSYQAGIFRNANGVGNDITANNGYVFTGRVTGLPINNINNEQLHIGLAYSHRKPSSGEYQISSKPEANLSSIKYINTSNLNNIKNIDIIGFETAYTKKAFSAQAEYIASTINRNLNNLMKYNFYSYYIQASYFLTGEMKSIKKSYKGFTRIKPINNFTGNKGVGAWEIALRYSNSDLNSKDIFGGEQSDVTLGLNWYLNPVARIMINQVLAHVKNSGNASIFQIRFQVEF